MRELKNKAAFYKRLRRTTGALNQRQVDTIEDLLRACAHWPIGFVAYALATAWHEARLEPIKERGGVAYLSKYDTGRLAKQLGNTPEADGDGVLFAGRGLVQLTGRSNYEKAGKALGLNLLKNPDLALQPDVATRILVWGMEGGHFTGKKLKDYIVDWGTHESFVRCRRIINGTDCDQKIADYADSFQLALHEGEWK